MAAEVMYDGVLTPIADLTDEQKQELRDANKRVVERIRVYLQSLSKGLNPLDGKPVSDGELLKYPRIVKMFGYLDSYFGRCIEKNGFGVKKIYAEAIPDIPNEKDILESTAKIIRAVSEGVNPFEGNRPAGANDLVRNEKVQAFLGYTAAILDICSVEKLPCSLTEAELEGFEYSDRPLKITEIKKRLDALVNLDIYNDVNTVKILTYLSSIGMLTKLENGYIPSQIGEQMGIHHANGKVVYDRRAQQLIVRNIPTILAKNSSEDGHKNNGEDNRSEND